MYVKEPKMHVAWSEQTKRAYQMDWKAWEEWAILNQKTLFPATSKHLVDYLEYLQEEGVRFSSIKRRTIAIGRIHEVAGELNPLRSEIFDTAMAQLRFDKEPVKKTTSTLSPFRVHAIIDQIAHEHIARETRDIAIILLLHATGLRRSEIAGLHTQDVQFLKSGGLELTLNGGTNRYHKTQSQLFIPENDEEAYCPVLALEEWLGILNIRKGPLFRPINKGGRINETSSMSGRAIFDVVRRWSGELRPSSFR